MSKPFHRDGLQRQTRSREKNMLARNLKEQLNRIWGSCGLLDFSLLISKDVYKAIGYEAFEKV